MEGGALVVGRIEGDSAASCDVMDCDVGSALAFMREVV